MENHHVAREVPGINRLHFVAGLVSLRIENCAARREIKLSVVTRGDLRLRGTREERKLVSEAVQSELGRHSLHGSPCQEKSD